MPLPLLQQLIERVRFREGAESGPVRAEWLALRAPRTGALADRGSRLALYDLRESLESAREPLPVDFLGAAAAIGDVTCLEPLAAAYAHAIEAGRQRRRLVAPAADGRVPVNRRPRAGHPAHRRRQADHVAGGRRPRQSSGLDEPKRAC